jgi:DNA-binding NarL/FixJ family response regulator
MATAGAHRKAGAGRRSGGSTEGKSLSPRQRQVLALVAQGLTNREIGAKLGISVRTVEVHRFSLMRRVRASNVAQLLRQALLRGLLPKNFLTRASR